MNAALNVAVDNSRRATDAAAQAAVADRTCLIPGALDAAMTAAAARLADLDQVIAAVHPTLDERARRSVRRQLLGYSAIPSRSAA